MFGRSQEIVLQPYGSRRSGWRLPRWFVLLLLGTAAGAAIVLTVQERYLPPRLSAHASEQLRGAFDLAEAERLRLKNALADANARLTSLRSDIARTSDELASQTATAARLRDDLHAVVAALPADPRGGAVAVRAGRFTVKGGQLDYSVVLTRELAVGKPLPGRLQFLLTGDSARGAATQLIPQLTPQPIPLKLGGQEVLRGSVVLPAGFRPRQATVQVLDRAGGKALATRVLLVQ